MEEVIVVNNRAAMAMVDSHFDSSCGMWDEYELSGGMS